MHTKTLFESNGKSLQPMTMTNENIGKLDKKKQKKLVEGFPTSCPPVGKFSLQSLLFFFSSLLFN
jgi:hypothetical protein